MSDVSLWQTACKVGVVYNGKIVTNLSRIVNSASVGGSGGYAFQIVENGYTAKSGWLFTDSDGYPSAYPYWNIYSNNSPGQWRLPGTNGAPVYFELKRDSTNAYRYSLGDFDGYNPDALPPSIGDIHATFQQNVTVSNVEIMAHTVSLGSYDWTKLGGISKMRVWVDDSSYTGVTITSDPITIGSGNPVIKIKTLVTTGVFTYDLPMYIMLCDSTGADIATLPIKGTFTVETIGVTTVRIYARITGSNGNAGTVIGKAETGQYGQTTVTNTGTVNNAVKALSGYSLSSVQIVCKDANGNTVYDKTREPNWIDSPSDPSGFKETSSVTLTAYVPDEAWNTITSTGCSVTIYMTYN